MCLYNLNALVQVRWNESMSASSTLDGNWVDIHKYHGTLRAHSNSPIQSMCCCFFQWIFFFVSYCRSLSHTDIVFQFHWNA